MGYLRKAGGFWELLRFWYPLGWIQFAVILLAGGSIPLGGTAALLLAGSLLAGGVSVAVLLPLLPEEGADSELLALARALELPGEYTLTELHRTLGIPARELRRLVNELVPLELYNLVYHRRQGALTVLPRSAVLDSCPRCGAGLPPAPYGRCPGCRAHFARAVEHLSYSLLEG